MLDSFDDTSSKRQERRAARLAIENLIDVDGCDLPPRLSAGAGNQAERSQETRTIVPPERSFPPEISSRGNQFGSIAKRAIAAVVGSFDGISSELQERRAATQRLRAVHVLVDEGASDPDLPPRLSSTGAGNHAERSHETQTTVPPDGQSFPNESSRRNETSKTDSIAKISARHDRRAARERAARVLESVWEHDGAAIDNNDYAEVEMQSFAMDDLVDECLTRFDQMSPSDDVANILANAAAAYDDEIPASASARVSPASRAPRSHAVSSALYDIRNQASPPSRKEYQKYFWGLFALLVIIGGEKSVGKVLRSRHQASVGSENDEPGGTSPPSSVWRQLGQSIDGEAKGDSFGKSVALFADGMTVVVGAPYSSEDENGDEQGQVKIYHMMDDGWSQIGNTMYGEGQWGWSVALSSDEGAFAIGAPSFWDDDQPGYVRVYARDGSFQSIYSEALSDSAGWSVSVSGDGNLLAVGAPWDSDGGEQYGQVRVYEWVDGAYDQLGTSIHGEAPQDKLGYSVSLSEDGKVLAVFATQSRREPGYVKVYHWDDATRDYQQLGGAIVGEDAFDSSGYSVALSTDGTTLAVGTNGLDENGDSSGHVRVYRIDEGADGSSWKQIGQDVQGEADDNSGKFVDLSADGGTLAVGIPYDGENSDDSGHVRVYRVEDGDAGPMWKQIGQSIGGEGEGVWSGTSVSLAADGRTLAIGANGNGGNGSYTGQVRVYRLEEV